MEEKMHDIAGRANSHVMDDFETLIVSAARLLALAVLP